MTRESGSSSSSTRESETRTRTESESREEIATRRRAEETKRQEERARKREERMREREEKMRKRKEEMKKREEAAKRRREESSRTRTDTSSRTRTDTSSSNTGERERRRHSTCFNCTAEGKVIPGNTRFELEKDCVQYKYCTCLCDGSWKCPDRFAKRMDNCVGSDVTDEIASAQVDSGSNTRTNTRDQCAQCQIQDQTFQPNTRFEIQNSCILYKNCDCFCNGSWACPEEYAKEVCR